LNVRTSTDVRSPLHCCPNSSALAQGFVADPRGRLRAGAGVCGALSREARPGGGEEQTSPWLVRSQNSVQLTVRVKPAQKKRPGRNPATGEAITIGAKPASVDVRARPLARAKGALPSVQKARRRLAA
jgi:hypothetical protein